MPVVDGKYIVVVYCGDAFHRLFFDTPRSLGLRKKGEKRKERKEGVRACALRGIGPGAASQITHMTHPLSHQA